MYIHPRAGLAALALALTLSAPVGARRPAPPPSAGTVTFELRSPLDGAVVPAGTLVRWFVSARAAGAQGLALFSVDLVADPTNPAALDLEPGRPASPEAQRFDWPAGLANPGSPPGASAFGGTPVGPDGAHDLAQLGGAQNTFGVAGPCFGPGGSVCVGQETFVLGGVGNAPGGVDLVTGAFRAPSTPGTYRVSLARPVANTLLGVSAPPAASPVGRAEALLADATIEITVP